MIELMNTENKSSSSTAGSGQSGQSGSNRRRRRGGRNRRPQNKNTGNNQPQVNAGQAQRPSGGPSANRNRNSRNRRGASRKGRPTLSGFDLISANYDKILTDHLEARKKYFEMYYRAQPAQRDKLERLFYESLDKLYSFAESVPPEFREEFEKKVNGLRFDRVYSEHREISAEGELEIRSENEIEDPHYLESQKSANYADDTEESIGTVEDYNNYKGL